MDDCKSGEHSNHQPFLGLLRQFISPFVRTIELVGVVLAITVILYDFRVLLPQERKLQHLQLNIEIAKLADQGDAKIVSPTIRYILETMYEGGAAMTGIAVPGMEFYMAEFEDVVWQRVNMDDVDFSCSDQAYDKIDDWEDGDPKNLPCTRLRKVDFTGASLRETRFHYADLREADFTAADLTEARIRDSFVSSGAKFLEGVSLRGVKIKNSDFSGAQFSPDAKFRCTVQNKECVELRRSDFSSALMDEILFRGAEIDRVDFTEANLKEARFECERPREGGEPCTILENVCVRDADLSRARFEGAELLNVDLVGANISKARFEGTTIKNTDFTGADLSDVRFTKVEFEQVVLTKEQEMVAEFDKDSLASLHAARQETLVSEYSDEVPCSSDWNRHISNWRDGIALPE